MLESAYKDSHRELDSGLGWCLMRAQSVGRVARELDLTRIGVSQLGPSGPGPIGRRAGRAWNASSFGGFLQR